MGIEWQKEKCPWMIQEGKIEQNGLKIRKNFMSASWTNPCLQTKVTRSALLQQRLRRILICFLRDVDPQSIEPGRYPMLKEFKSFAMRGNVVDLAIGVVIGAAFGKIVESVVSDLIMPLIGAVTGGLDFSNYYLPLSGAVKTGLAYQDAKKAGAVLGYGNFITVLIGFIIIAWVLFIIMKALNRMNLSKPKAPARADPSGNPAH